MTNVADGAAVERSANHAPAVEKAQLVIDQSQYARLLGALGHFPGLARVHGHRFFAEHMLAMIERRERYLHVGGWRRHYADEIDIVARDQLTPIVGHVTDFEFIGSALGIFTMGARNRHNARANAVFASRNLRRKSVV